MDDRQPENAAQQRSRLRGQADFRRGLRLDQNPFPSIKKGKRSWIKGWHEAREHEAYFQKS